MKKMLLAGDEKTLKGVMLEDELLKIVNDTINEKVMEDISNLNSNRLSERKPIKFNEYLHDKFLLKYGLISQANIKIVSFVNGMTASSEIGSYNKYILRLIGLGIPPIRPEEVEIML